MRGIEKSEGLGNNRFGNERESIETKAKKKKAGSKKEGFLKKRRGEKRFFKASSFFREKMCRTFPRDGGETPREISSHDPSSDGGVYLPRLAHSRVRGRERYGLLNEFHLCRVWRERGSEGSSTWH